jgi:hypothetical protein
MKDQFVRITCAMAVLFTAVAARTAHADTFLFEAENAATLSNPLLIKDAFAGSATPASLGRFVEVQPGKNNKTGSQPAVDPSTGAVAGQICFGMFFGQAGDYRIYGRVIAPTDGDDSFWVRVIRTNPSEPWINWNTISLGGSWHWDSIHLNNSTTPILFHFNAEEAATLCIAAREDGTRLDSLLVTSDPAVNPITATQPIVTDSPFNSPLLPQLEILPGKNSLFLQWTAVPGATSYALKNKIPNFDLGENCFNADPASFTTVSSTSAFTFADTNAARGAFSCYLVTATGGGSTISSFILDAARQPALFRVHESSAFSATLPLEFTGSITRTNPSTGVVENVENGGLGSQPTVPKQLDANAITKGFARWDFQLAESTTLRIWGLNTFFDSGTDSFWVRMDRGAWFKWNGWKEDPTSGCSKDVFRASDGEILRNGGGWVPVWDGDNPNAPRKTFNLGTGTHTLELAFREPAAGMDRIALKSELDTSPGGCFD